MLQPAILHKEEVLKKLYSTWHEDKYKWLYADGYSDEWIIEDSAWNCVQFVSICDNIILGFIQYRVTRPSQRAGSLIIVGFENNPLFIRDVLQAIDDIFNFFQKEEFHYFDI